MESLQRKDTTLKDLTTFLLFLYWSTNQFKFPNPTKRKETIINLTRRSSPLGRPPPQQRGQIPGKTSLLHFYFIRLPYPLGVRQPHRGTSAPMYCKFPLARLSLAPWSHTRGIIGESRIRTYTPFSETILYKPLPYQFSHLSTTENLIQDSLLQIYL